MKTVFCLIALLFLYFCLFYGNLRKKGLVRERLPKILSREWLTGRDLREILRKNGISMTGQFFYGYLHDLECEGVVESMESSHFAGGKPILVTSYRLSEKEYEKVLAGATK